MKRLALILILAVAIPLPAHAFYLTCGQATSLILNGDQQQKGIAVGHGTGTIDMLTALACYVRRPNCTCLDRMLVNNVRAYSDAIAQELAACAANSPGDSAVGPALRAAERLCGS